MRTWVALVLGLTAFAANVWAGPACTFHRSGIMTADIKAFEFYQSCRERRTTGALPHADEMRLNALMATGSIIQIKEGQECEELQRINGYVKIRLPGEEQAYWTHVCYLHLAWAPEDWSWGPPTPRSLTEPPGPPPNPPLWRLEFMPSASEGSTEQSVVLDFNSAKYCGNLPILNVPTDKGSWKCRWQERKAIHEIANMKHIPFSIVKYCKGVAESAGGSWQICHTCIEKEMKLRDRVGKTIQRNELTNQSTTTDRKNQKSTSSNP